MILIKSVLQNLSIYWISLAKVPAKIKSNICQICTSFLWKGARKSTGFHLVKWEMVSRRKVLGGWGF
jgi:RNase P subunit RPR2